MLFFYARTESPHRREERPYHLGGIIHSPGKEKSAESVSTLSGPCYCVCMPFGESYRPIDRTAG